jgi:hypothetical protein
MTNDETSIRESRIITLDVPIHDSRISIHGPSDFVIFLNGVA